MERAGVLTVVVVLVAWASAPATGQRRADTNRVVSVNYGEVIGVERVQLQSNAATGAVVGGLAGLAIRGGGRTTRSVARGAAIGGVGTRLLEGSNEANEYTVRLMAGRDVRIVTEPTGIRLGDCVSVEQGRQANIRRVSTVHCEGQASEPTESHQAAASACDQAKERLLEAEDDEAMERAVTRIRILCED